MLEHNYLIDGSYKHAKSSRESDQAGVAHERSCLVISASGVDQSFSAWKHGWLAPACGCV